MSPARFPLLTTQAQVLHALMLRDMRTRFGRSHWGYLVAVIWPFCHILVLVTMMLIRRMPDPLGDSVILFITSGCLPMITFVYITRKLMEAVGLNRTLTFFPQVTMLDVIVARTVLEVAGNFAVLVAIFIFLTVVGLDPVPHDVMGAFYAYLATVVLSCGIGIVNGCIVMFFPPFAVGWILVIILLYGLSGIYMVPEIYPEEILQYLRWNPMLHCASAMRAAYYPTYKPEVDLMYPVLFGGCLLLVGLLLDRLVVRGRPI